jgi:hypothetical protein
MARFPFAPALAAALGAASVAGPAYGQPPQQQTSPPLEIGAVAPDFSLPGATRYGTLRDPIRLSHFQGKTVVLAFFFRARTRG